MTQSEIRAWVSQLSISGQKLNARKQLQNNKAMPLLKDSPKNQQYEELYRKSAQWTTKVEGHIDKLTGKKKMDTEKLRSAAKICVNDMIKMRKAGRLNTKLKEAKLWWN